MKKSKKSFLTAGLVFAGFELGAEAQGVRSHQVNFTKNGSATDGTISAAVCRTLLSQSLVLV